MTCFTTDLRPGNNNQKLKIYTKQLRRQQKHDKTNEFVPETDFFYFQIHFVREMTENKNKKKNEENTTLLKLPRGTNISVFISKLKTKLKLILHRPKGTKKRKEERQKEHIFKVTQ